MIIRKLNRTLSMEWFTKYVVDPKTKMGLGPSGEHSYDGHPDYFIKGELSYEPSTCTFEFKKKQVWIPGYRSLSSFVEM